MADAPACARARLLKWFTGHKYDPLRSSLAGRGESGHLQAYGREKAATERELSCLCVGEQARLEEIACRLETLAASWDHAAPEGRREMIRMLFGVEYCEPGEQRFARLQPEPKLVVSFRQAGIPPEVGGLVWPSAPLHAEASISAP